MLFACLTSASFSAPMCNEPPIWFSRWLYLVRLPCARGDTETCRRKVAHAYVISHIVSGGSKESPCKLAPRSPSLSLQLFEPSSPSGQQTGTTRARSPISTICQHPRSFRTHSNGKTPQSRKRILETGHGAMCVNSMCLFFIHRVLVLFPFPPILFARHAA